MLIDNSFSFNVYNISQKLNIIMSRILSYPYMGQLKLYQITSYVHISSLRRYFKNISPGKTHKGTYKYVEPNKFVHVKKGKDIDTYSEYDRILFKALQLFQQKLDVSYDTCIDVQFNRDIIDKEYKHVWTTYGASKVGVINVTQRKRCKFRDVANGYNNDISILLDQGQMIGYNENSMIESLMVPVNNTGNDSVAISDQMILTVE